MIYSFNLINVYWKVWFFFFSKGNDSISIIDCYCSESPGNEESPHRRIVARSRPWKMFSIVNVHRVAQHEPFQWLRLSTARTDWSTTQSYPTTCHRSGHLIHVSGHLFFLISEVNQIRSVDSGLIWIIELIVMLNDKLIHLIYQFPTFDSDLYLLKKQKANL